MIHRFYRRTWKERCIGVKIFLISLYYRFLYRVFKNKMPHTSDGCVYVNLGCGNNTSTEFINVDAVPFKHTHILGDIARLPMFPDNSIDLLYASHVIEHLPRKELLPVLKEWFRVLKPGGVLRFGVPNFDALIEMYEASGRDVNSIVNQTLGQDEPYDDHHTLWNATFAHEIMKTAGFTLVREWSPENVAHHDFHDKTNRFFESNGKHIAFSLNLEAIK